MRPSAAANLRGPGTARLRNPCAAAGHARGARPPVLKGLKLLQLGKAQGQRLGCRFWGGVGGGVGGCFSRVSWQGLGFSVPGGGGGQRRVRQLLDCMCKARKRMRNQQR